MVSLNYILSFLLYHSILGFVRSYKWVEKQVLKLATPFLRKYAVELGERIGLAIHCNGDLNFDPNGNLTPEQEKRILDKCKGKYKRIINVRFNDPNKYVVQAANQGTLGMGEGYMDRLWDVCGDDDDISEVIARVLENNLLDIYWNKWNNFLEWLQLSAFNLQTEEKAFEVGREHYDLGNDLYEQMLDPWMQYSCGYWAMADNLDGAQTDKLELIAKKLDLKPGMKVLDIGSGWGTLCKYLAENFKVKCVGITISEEGMAHGRKINEGLDVDIRLQDYRQLDEKFDRIVSVGMFEHVGFKNYQDFFQVVHRCLKDDGILLLHTIGKNHINIPRSDMWVHRYIFPNGNLPTPNEITTSSEKYFVIEDWHNFGPDYARTIAVWRDNFKKAWPSLKEKYDRGRFYRMWIYYLSLAVGLFRSRRLQLWQIVMSKDGLKTNYRAAR